MQHLAVQCPISTVQRTGKRLAINALILLRANGSFVGFSKGLHKKGWLQQYFRAQNTKENEFERSLTQLSIYVGVRH
jgi:hypothetical protein